MSNERSKKGPRMAMGVGKSKSAMDSLTKSFDNLVAQARQRMSEKEFQRAEKKFDQIAKKVRASRGQRRETA